MRARRTRPVSDRHEIRARIYRKGKTLTEVALDAGLSESACRAALIRPLPSGEAAIAEFLDTTVQELWPERYPTLPTPRRKHDTNAGGEASLNAATVQTPHQSIRAVNP